MECQSKRNDIVISFFILYNFIGDRMKLFIGDRQLDLTDKELDSLYLNEGHEITAYLLGKDVLKLYKENTQTDKFTVKDIMRFSKLKLNRFLVPNKPVRDDSLELVGFTAPYKVEDPFDTLYDINGKDFKREVKIMLGDIKELSRNKIEIDDLHLDNIIYSDNAIYFSDCGCFKYKQDEDTREIERTNMVRFEYFIVNYLLARSLAKKNRKKLESEYEECNNIEEFISTMDDKENIGNFAKRVIR